MIDAKHLPIRLPEVEKYLPTEDGQPPLGNAKEWYWNTKTNSVCSPPLEGLGEDIFPLELNTMPGWAGSSWYWLRYMDANNENEFASQKAIDYWQNVDLYIGGSEHATGHLLYSRFWNKFLKDMNIVPTEEPFQKLINQGMILGMSAYAYRLNIAVKSNKIVNSTKDTNSVYNIFISKNDLDRFQAGGRLPETIQDKIGELYLQDISSLFNFEANIDKISDSKFHVKYNNEDFEITTSFTFDPYLIDSSVINESSNELNIQSFKNNALYINDSDAEFIPEENGKYIVGRE